MKITFTLILVCQILFSCSTKNKISRIKKENLGAEITLSDIHRIDTINIDKSNFYSDTLTVINPQGERVHFMKAVIDSTGTLHATEELEGAVISARFRNIPERNGKVKVAFDIHIPAGLIDSRWQIRFAPFLFILQDTIALDRVHITGKDYLEKQLRGYELYQKFLDSIITDPNELIYIDLLEIFIERNFPELAAIKNDTAFIDPSVRGIYNISLLQAKEYYTKRIAKYLNNKKIESKEEKYNQYIKDPIIVDGVRIDSIVDNHTKGITYYYSHWVETRKDLRKIDLTLKGAIFKDGKELLEIPETEPLTYYVSSFSTMFDNTVRYITKVIERKAIVETKAQIDFKVNQYTIDETLERNITELSKIKNIINDIINNQEFNLDSIIITASCSPDGKFKNNSILASKRANHIKKYFEEYTETYIGDIIDKESSYLISLNDDERSSEKVIPELNKEFQNEIYTYHIAEDWDSFFELINSNNIIENKEKILELSKIQNLDQRERTLSSYDEYLYIKENIYPALRRVKFDFHLHRKGMVKDTIHTTEIDTIYNKGIEALKNRDYHTAITILGEYGDINTALAFISLDYNASAMNILQTLPQSPKRDYLMAIIYSRLGNSKLAAEHYLYAVERDPSLRFRANLDPEISILIENYNLNHYENL